MLCIIYQLQNNDHPMLDENGLRSNVGIILSNTAGELFWGRRMSFKESWQFPQGGINGDETPQQAMYRELYEEVGLQPHDVELLAESRQWLCYYLPQQFQRPYQQPLCVGQKQKWFLLRLISSEDAICFTRTKKPEFSGWRWVNYWHPLQQVIDFKKAVYQQALEEFAPIIRELSPVPEVV